MNNLEKITKALRENNEAKFNEALTDLSTNITTLSKLFSLEIATPKTLSNIKESALQLKNTLTENYYIVPTQKDQLQIIANRCDYLSQDTEKI
jgi:hypothetical protein